jgi:FKBP-type peptidyl-prolyl cis-trans isomerase (trigger factor)
MTKSDQTKTKVTDTKETSKNETDKSVKTEPSMIAENSKITFKISKEKAQAAYQQTLLKFARTTASPGFRKGKAPLEIVESIVGKYKLLEKTFEVVAPDAYYDAVIAQKRHPITNPEFNPIKLDMSADWEIEAYFAERPEIKLGDYKKTVTAAIKTADKELADAAKANAQAPETKTGEKPKEPTPEQQKTIERETKLKHIFKELVYSVKPMVPELLVRQETRFELDNLLRQLEQFGLKLENYIAKRQITTEVLSQELAATALGRLQLEFVLGAIANEQKFTSSAEETSKLLEEVKDEKVRKQLKANKEYQEQLNATVIRQKVINFLLQ